MTFLRFPPFRAVVVAVVCMQGYAWGAPADDGTPVAEFYGKLYPEWKVLEFGTPSTSGTVVGTMGTLRNDSDVLTRDVSAKPDTDDHEWSNSYLGLRGEFGDGVRYGYDVQVTVDLQGDSNLGRNFEENFGTRDAFVYVDAPSLGRLAVGKMDSIYKEWGDRLRMFGVSSGNIVSTSRVLSSAGWKGRGTTSFHNRRSHTIGWFGPAISGFEAGLTHSWDEVSDGPGGADTRLTAAALRWREGPWYLALATEMHQNWLPLSRDAVPAASSIMNHGATTTSEDRAWRASMAWSKARWRLAADLSRLRYAENDAIELPGKFRAYRNMTWQVSAEYKLNEKIRLGANHAHAAAGRCSLSGGVACSTTGLGGHQTSLGVLYAVNRVASLFALAVHTSNGDAAIYGSAPQGGDVNAYALGVKLGF